MAVKHTMEARGMTQLGMMPRVGSRTIPRRTWRRVSSSPGRVVEAQGSG